MASSPPRRAGPLWLWLLALIVLLVAIWILIDGLTDDDFTGEATTPPAAEVTPDGEPRPRRDALRVPPRAGPVHPNGSAAPAPAGGRVGDHA